MCEEDTELGVFLTTEGLISSCSLTGRRRERASNARMGLVEAGNDVSLDFPDMSADTVGRVGERRSQAEIINPSCDQSGDNHPHHRGR